MRICKSLTLTHAVIADHQGIGSDKRDMFPLQRRRAKASAENDLVACGTEDRAQPLQIAVVEESNDHQSKSEAKASSADIYHQYAGKHETYATNSSHLQ